MTLDKSSRFVRRRMRDQLVGERRRARSAFHRAALLALLASPLACAADAAPAPTSVAYSLETAAPLATGASSPNELAATIRSITIQGGSCGSPSQNQGSIGADSTSALIGFENALVSDCLISIEMEFPSGYQLTGPLIAWHGDQEGTTTIHRSYEWQGGGGSWPVSSAASGLSYVLGDQPQLVFTGCSTGAQTATLIASLSALPSGTNLSSFDIGTRWQEGATWTDCEGNDVGLDGQSEGDFCGGPHNIGCAQGLVCDKDVRGAQVCVDPNKPLPRAAFGERCGGVRRVECQVGLTCWWPDETSAVNSWVGRCAEIYGGVNATCDSGVPALQCADGLFCQLGNHSCVLADGSVNAPCSDVMPCQAGLECYPGTYPNGAPATVCLPPDAGVDGMGDQQDQP